MCGFCGAGGVSGCSTMRRCALAATALVVVTTYLIRPSETLPPTPSWHAFCILLGPRNPTPPETTESLVKLFECEHCAGVLFFENTLCSGCNAPLGYCVETGRLTTVPDGAGRADVLCHPRRRIGTLPEVPQLLRPRRLQLAGRGGRRRRILPLMPAHRDRSRPLRRCQQGRLARGRRRQAALAVHVVRVAAARRLEAQTTRRRESRSGSCRPRPNNR